MNSGWLVCEGFRSQGNGNPLISDGWYLETDRVTLSADHGHDYVITLRFELS